MEDLPKQASLKVTIAKWFTPHGIGIDGTGLEPDVKVELPKDITEKDMDRDFGMEKAIEVLQHINSATASKE